MSKYSAQGILQYKKDGWLVLSTPKSICEYYKWWVEKFLWKKATLPLHGSHVTVIAGKYNDVSSHPCWQKYDGIKLSFYYDGVIYNDDDGYFWIKVECPELAAIRQELGLPPQPFWPYHCTICFINPNAKKTNTPAKNGVSNALK